ncbi:MAG: MFS transporter [Oscillospiraceae bacterium]|jgi:Na+/melibiose symporter-like transporter|nr:MFS transporter [Oscillospiraceae bacterium]
MSLNSFLAKVKVPESARNEIDQLTHHPVRWLKGENDPEGHLHPWEKLGFALNTFMTNSAAGFNGQGQLFNYTYHVNPNHMTVSGIITSFWDAFNDPFVGQWMDRNPMSDGTYRWIQRINHLINTLLNVLVLLDMGLTPLGHVVLLTAVTMFRDILGTFAGVSYTKYFAAITPYSSERGKSMVWGAVGMQVSYAIYNLPAYFMGLAKDRLKFSDYNIYVYGTLILLPLAIVGGWVHTFAKKRVSFNPVGADGIEKPTEDRRSLRETIAVLKHNKYLMLSSAASFFTVFTPTTDELPIYRYIMPRFNVRGHEVRGETLMSLRKQFSGIPITILYPFIGMITNKVGGPKRMQVISRISYILIHAARFLLDPRKFKNGLLPVLGIIGVEMVFETLGPMDGYAGNIINYEMLDYVEYKTGVRSEGMTVAFRALFDKMITGNINRATGNLFQKWSGINEVDQSKGEMPSERYMKWAWFMYNIAPAADSVIYLIAWLLFKYDPQQKNRVEAELLERRKLQAEADSEA